MCSFLFSTKTNLTNLKEINRFLKFRGPDHTEIQTINNNTFLHNLLSITGNFAPQPFLKDNIALIYNGEIYNYTEFGNYKTDGECLIPLYQEYGPTFVQKLDGEYAICLVDYNKNKIVISSDVFKTKPLFIANDSNHLSCSTYKTPLELLGHTNIIKAKPNTIYEFCLKTKQLCNTQRNHTFCLKQYKETYEDWNNSFKKAISKRVEGTSKKIFIGLSSGYDSGLIFKELIDLNTSFYTFSLTGTENQKVIEDRLCISANRGNIISQVIPKTDKDFNLSHILIQSRTEPFLYTIKSDDGTHQEKGLLLTRDGGSNNFATICRAAKKEGCKICISGMGADEIISDYGVNGTKFYPHSNFGGLFPDDLATIFPWGSFFGSTMESYLAKEEYVGGSFGIEVRYPFLDKD